MVHVRIHIHINHTIIDLIYIIFSRLSIPEESESFASSMLHASQIRAARALLSWSQDQLADVSDVEVATIRRIEVLDGVVTGMSQPRSGFSSFRTQRNPFH